MSEPLADLEARLARASAKREALRALDAQISFVDLAASAARLRGQDATATDAEADRLDAEYRALLGAA